MSIKNRRSPRIPMQLEVELLHDVTGEMVLKTKDISETGVFVKMPPEDQPAIGTECLVRLKDNFADGEEPQTLTMRVVRQTENGIGLEFV